MQKPSVCGVQGNGLCDLSASVVGINCTRDQKARRQTTMTNKTMFGPAKNQYLADMISLRNPSAARGSIRELRNEFSEAATLAKKLRVARATQLASNRAGVMSKNTRLSVKERTEAREMCKMYKSAASGMFLTYRVLSAIKGRVFRDLTF